MQTQKGFFKGTFALGNILVLWCPLVGICTCKNSISLPPP